MYIYPATYKSVNTVWQDGTMGGSSNLQIETIVVNVKRNTPLKRTDGLQAHEPSSCQALKYHTILLIPLCTVRVLLDERNNHNCSLSSVAFGHNLEDLKISTLLPKTTHPGWMAVSNNCLTVSPATQIYYARLIALFSRMIGWFLLISKSTNIDWIRIENRHTWSIKKRGGW